MSFAGGYGPGVYSTVPSGRALQLESTSAASPKTMPLSQGPGMHSMAASLLSLRTVLSRLPTAFSYHIFFSDPSLMTQLSLPRLRSLHIVTDIRDRLTSFFSSHPSTHFTP